MNNRHLITIVLLLTYQVTQAQVDVQNVYVNAPLSTYGKSNSYELGVHLSSQKNMINFILGASAFRSGSQLTKYQTSWGFTAYNASQATLLPDTLLTYNQNITDHKGFGLRLGLEFSNKFKHIEIPVRISVLNQLTFNENNESSGVASNHKVINIADVQFGTELTHTERQSQTFNSIAFVHALDLTTGMLFRLTDNIQVGPLLGINTITYNSRYGTAKQDVTYRNVTISTRSSLQLRYTI